MFRFKGLGSLGFKGLGGFGLEGLEFRGFRVEDLGAGAGSPARIGVPLKSPDRTLKGTLGAIPLQSLYSPCITTLNSKQQQRPGTRARGMEHGSLNTSVGTSGYSGLRLRVEGDAGNYKHQLLVAIPRDPNSPM